MANAGLTFRLFGEDVSASSALEEVGKSGKKVAGALATAFGAMALGDIITDSLDREKTFAKFNAGWDASPKLAKKAADLAGKLYAQGIGEGMDQVVGAIDAVGVQMVDLGKTSPAELEKITAGALNIAEVMGVDIVEVTRAAGQMMKNGLAPDAMAALDIIASGATSGANASGDLLDTLTEYSPSFGRLGIDGDTALSMINAGLGNGIFTADLAADAFKEFGIRALDVIPSATGLATASADAMQSLGFDAQSMAEKIAMGGPAAQEATRQIMEALGKMTDPVAQQTAGVALFGTQWEDSGAKSILAMTPVNTATGELKGATERMGVALLDTATNKVDRIKRSFENWTTALIETDGWIGTAAATAVLAGPQLLTAGGSIAMIAVATKGLWIGMAGVVASAAAMLAPLLLIAAALAAVIALVKTAMDNIGRMSSQWEAAKRGDFATASSLRAPLAMFNNSGAGRGNLTAYSMSGSGIGVVANGIGRVTPSYGAGRMRPMASGGIVTGPTPALIGEGGEPEAVIPLSKWSQMTGGSGAGDVHIHMPQGLVVGTADEIVQKLADLVATARRRGTLADGAFA